MTYVLSGIGAGLVLAAVLVVLSRRNRFDDVARFHRAREMTTAWAQTSGRTAVPDPDGTDPDGTAADAPPPPASRLELERR